jgi:hypothetical protein
MNYPLIAVRSHYMINYMVIIRLIIIVTTYYITFAKQHKTETERLRRWGSVWGSVGGVLAKHPPRWNAFVERRSRQLGGVLAYSRQNAAQSANLWFVNNGITVRQQRHYGSSATTLLLVDGKRRDLQRQRRTGCSEPTDTTKRETAAGTVSLRNRTAKRITVCDSSRPRGVAHHVVRLCKATPPEVGQCRPVCLQTTAGNGPHHRTA